MEITDVRIRKIVDEGRVKAVVSVTFDNELVVHDMRVIEGNGRVFVATPSRRGSDGSHRDIVHPINSEFRKKLEDAVLEKYHEELEAAGSYQMDEFADDGEIDNSDKL